MGRQVRDAKAWAYYIDEAIDIFNGRYDVIFASHHWPTWTAESGVEFLKKQRDMYKYLHDETLRLANQGFTMLEIPELIELPADLFHAWYNRGYYGSINHNVKAIYHRYLGFFDGNPATLHPLPPEAAGVKYVEFMGGADNLLAQAQQSFDKGEYRWVAQVVNHLVFADPDNKAARRSASRRPGTAGLPGGVWPVAQFLPQRGQRTARRRDRPRRTQDKQPRCDQSDTAGYVLRPAGGTPDWPQSSRQEDRPKCHFTDIDEQYLLVVENGVLNYAKGKQDL